MEFYNPEELAMRLPHLVEGVGRRALPAAETAEEEVAEVEVVLSLRFRRRRYGGGRRTARSEWELEAARIVSAGGGEPDIPDPRSLWTNAPLLNGRGE